MQQEKKSAFNAADTAALELLANALFEKPLALPLGAELSHVFCIGREQAMLGVMSEGLSALPEDAVPHGLMQEWTQHTVATIRRNEALLAAQGALLAHCERLAIPVVILKGFSAACDYPTPDLRAAGDVDCLVPEAELARLCEALEQDGYEREAGLDEHHVAYVKNGLMLELHFKIPGIPEKGRAGGQLREAFSDIFACAEQATLEGARFPVPAPRHRALILLLHIAKHLRDGGVGLRQVSDLALFAAKHGEVFDAELLALLRDTGLFYFAACVLLGCVRHLGLCECCVPWVKEADDEMADALFAEFLRAGNFGRGDAAEYAGSGMAHKERRRGECVLLSALRGVADMCRREWPVSKKCPPLLLFLVPFWIIRRLFDRSKPRVRPFKMLRCAGERARLHDALCLFEPNGDGAAARAVLTEDTNNDIMSK